MNHDHSFNILFCRLVRLFMCFFTCLLACLFVRSFVRLFVCLFNRVHKVPGLQKLHVSNSSHLSRDSSLAYITFRTHVVYWQFQFQNNNALIGKAHTQGRIWGGGGGGGFLDSGNPPPLPYACTFSKRNKTKKQPLDPARGPMRPPGLPAETPPPPPPPHD